MLELYMLTLYNIGNVSLCILFLSTYLLFTFYFVCTVSKTDCLIKYVNTTLRCENLLILLSAKTGLKPIGPIALNWSQRWSYLLSAVQVHTTAHCRCYREQHWASYL